MTAAAIRTRATLIGFSAVLMWATLALFTTLSGAVPPFQLLAMTFGVAAVIGVVIPVVRGGRPFGHYRQRPTVWLLGVG